MIIDLCFKNPQALGVAVEHIKNEDEREQAIEACNKFIRWGEYVVVEVDTETGLARVRPV
jgi:hypothetical protein